MSAIAALLSLALLATQDPGSSAIGLQPTGPVTVNARADRGDIVATAPVSHRNWALLTSAITSDRYRLPAEALVYRTRFGSPRAEAADAVEAWCGMGQTKRLLNWADTLVCVVDTPDGKATMAEGHSNGAWWSPMQLAFADQTIRVDRPSVRPAPERAVLLTSTWRFTSVFENTLVIGRATEGPVGDGLRTVNDGGLLLPLLDGEATVRIGEQVLTLTPDEDGRALSIASEPASDLAGEPAAPLADASEAASPAATPLVSGAVLFDPNSLTVTSGPVGRRGVLATGPASHARTGRVQRAFRVGPMAGFSVEAGSDWHHVEVARVDDLGIRTRTGFWCGPAEAIHMFGRDPVAACIVPLGRGLWRLFPAPGGQPWLVGSVPPTAINTLTNEFEIVAHPTDVVGPFEVDIVVRDLNDRRIRLEARGRRGEDSVVFWRGEFDWSADMAVVPLWTHRMTLRRQGRDVVAELSADGDGTGLLASTAL